MVMVQWLSLAGVPGAVGVCILEVQRMRAVFVCPSGLGFGLTEPVAKSPQQCVAVTVGIVGRLS